MTCSNSIGLVPAEYLKSIEYHVVYLTTRRTELCPLVSLSEALSRSWTSVSHISAFWLRIIPHYCYVQKMVNL